MSDFDWFAGGEPEQKIEGAEPTLVIFDEVSRWLKTGGLDEIGGDDEPVGSPGVRASGGSVRGVRAVGVARPYPPRPVARCETSDAEGSAEGPTARVEADQEVPEVGDDGRPQLDAGA